MFSRRQFLGRTAAVGAGLYLVSRGGVIERVPIAVAAEEGLLDPTGITKYGRPLVIPPAMPGRSLQTKDLYQIAIRQFQQQILPPSMPGTTVWSYGSVDHPGTFNFPAFTIEARWGRETQVVWRNELMDERGRYLPHLLPIDPTLHWANPPGGKDGRDTRPTFSSTPGSYTGPVPMVTHVHGAHTTEDSDGYPEAWYLPDARDIPKGYARTGTYFDLYNKRYHHGWEYGAASFKYPNDQRAATLWYHDHTLGMTRTNVYAGPAGFYLLRGGPDDVETGLPGPAPGVGDSPFGTYYEIPIVIQDRSFYGNGGLFYPETREFFDGYSGPYIPGTPVPPIWQPEFFGDTIVVNGRTWPQLTVEQRRYRLRFLNGCDSRFLVLKIASSAEGTRPVTPALPFWQIGGDGGFLPQPVELGSLLMGPAERADVIVDFTAVPAGTQLYLINEGPDEPFGGGEPPGDFDGADPATTGQVMRFDVVAASEPETSTPPDQLTLPAAPDLGSIARTRKLSLNEEAFESGLFEGPVAALLGTVDDDGNPVTALWMDAVTEDPAVGDTEVWEVYNFTADAHPIHVHLVQFEVVDRQALETDAEGMTTAPAALVGAPMDPESWETGPKDTVIAYPGQVTRVKARFDVPGRFVWHCHILEHEDNEMMRPYDVRPSS